MPVTYLELENFKSYAGIQRIGPFQDFTSIIGPNGSGKSNLMDAISFVLGVHSRNLRSSQLKDLIFRPPNHINDIDNDNGNDSDTDNDNDTDLKASATLVYVDPLTDIETRFSRTISKKGVGEYKINSRTVPFTKYEQQLSTIGVLLKGRNFLVFQGDVESTARKSPKELTAWFEEISQSSEVREEYESSLLAMNEADKHVRDISKKQNGYTKEKRQLKVQKEEAERYQSQVAAKRKLLTEFFLWQMYHIREDITEKDEYIHDVNEEIQESNSVISQKTQTLKKAKKGASQARSKANTLEKQRVELAAEVDQAQPTSIQTLEEIKTLSKKISTEESKLQKLQQETESRNDTLGNLQSEIAEYTETETQLKQEYEEQKNKRGSKDSTSLTEEQEVEYESIKETVAVATVKPRQTLNMASRKLESVKTKAASVQEEVKDLKARQQDAMDRFKELIERKQNLEKSVEKTKVDLKQGKKDLQTIQKQSQEAQGKRKTIDMELEKINQKLLECRDDRRNNQHEARLEEAIASLKRYFPGVKDRLVKLCQPTQRRFDLAVTVAGGKDMDAVVVDTKQTASDCIQWLRSNQIGTATFLPLDTLQVPSSDSTERIRAMVEQDSRYRLAYDVIACDESVKKAVLYAVGNSVVSDDLDCARELCFSSQNKRRRNDEARIKAVTLGGAVISKAGTMTGGVSNEDRSRAGRWDDREVQKLRSRKEELENQLAELDNDNQGNAHGDRRASRGGHNYKIEELRNLVGNLTNRLQYSQSDLEFTTKKVKEQEVLITSITSQVKKGERQLEETEGQLEAAGVNAQKAADEVKQLEEEHYTPFLEKTGMQDFHAYGEAVGKAREDYFKKVRIIRQHLEKLKAQKIYEEGRDTDSAMKKKTKTLENIRKKLENAQIREGKISNSVAKAKAKLADIESKLEQAREEETEHEEKVRDAQKDYKSSQQDVAKLNKNLSNEEANLDRLRAKQHETLQTARVEEAELPQTDESNAETSTQVSNKLDYSSLRRDLKQRRSDRDFNKMQKKFQENLEKMTTQIEVMAPNMKAGDAFDSVIDQLEECNEDYVNAKEAAKEAMKKFNDIKRERTDRFNGAFEHIADSLASIYRDMTKSSKHPYGGKAFIDLEDIDEPYNGGIKFSAMPPMKRYRDMEYLSGGEKTVASLALLFAIHSYHPAPFFVMDEVDAALDNVNVLKLCNYIKQRSVDFQCIVISLKDTFYEKSQSLVGICRDVKSNSSKTLTLDLSKFDLKNDKERTAAKKRRRISSLGPRKRTSLSPRQDDELEQ